jgi:HD-like signal output (HDOD) protein
MKVTCSNCQKSYNLPDNRLPQGKVLSFSCPACKTKIEINPCIANADDQCADRLVFKPLCQESDCALTNDEIKKKIIKKIEELPPMPKVLLKAREIIGNENSGFNDIAKIIETDQAIAAKVLKVANSAYYGLSGMVSSIHQASVVLGYQTLEQVITVVSTSSLLGAQLKGYNLSAGALWKHSLAVAIVSRDIARKRAPSVESDAFSVGLIHDAGKLALDAYVFQKREQIDNYLREQNTSFLLAEREILGFDHTEIAYDLCRKWKLPEDHAIAMRFHHAANESSENKLAFIVHTANAIAAMAGLSGGPGFEETEILPEALAALRLKPEDIQALSAQLTESVDEITASLA